MLSGHVSSPRLVAQPNGWHCWFGGSALYSWNVEHPSKPSGVVGDFHIFGNIQWGMGLFDSQHDARFIWIKLGLLRLLIYPNMIGRLLPWTVQWILYPWCLLNFLFMDQGFYLLSWLILNKYSYISKWYSQYLHTISINQSIYLYIYILYIYIYVYTYTLYIYIYIYTSIYLYIYTYIYIKW